MVIRLDRHEDGSAGDADYGVIGGSYADYRRPDPRIAARIFASLGRARTVLNIGAGAGSYEPRHLDVTAVEPSASMRALRPADLAVAIDAVAEDLPFPDRHFDAAMATFAVHQWPDLEAGLREARRVTRGPIALLTCDPALLDRFWLADYSPEVIAVEARRYPAIARIAAALGGTTDIVPVPIPLDCADGFQEAYYGRPESLLDAQARLACSAWSFVDAAAVARMEERLGDDLRTGAWDATHGRLRTQPVFEGALQIVVNTP